MIKTCRNCAAEFEITKSDEHFYEKIKVPSPTFCPECRQQRRLTYRNERFLYHRNCDLCGKRMLAQYHEDVKMKIYCPDCWWSDKWESTDYGRDFDFNRLFFEQFDELNREVPHISLNVRSNENSEYVNLSGYNKNCYLIFGAEYDEDCMYGTHVIKCVNCVDTFNCNESESCYEVTDVSKCYELFFSQNCRNCNSSMFLYDCQGCTDCLFCSNLRTKNYYIFNKRYSKEEYENKKKVILDDIKNGRLPDLLIQFKNLRSSSIHKNLQAKNNENSVGSYLFDSKNCFDCYDVTYAEDCKYLYQGFQGKDLMDICHMTEGELGYEGISIGYNSFNIQFGIGAWTSHDMQYFDTLPSCSNMFGCAGMTHKKYCIFNKQYSKESYETLREKIINHMRSTGEYGEFFPAKYAPYAYNETPAHEYFPLTKEQAVSKGLKWKDPDKKDYRPAHDDVLACSNCGKNYKMQSTEKAFYKKHSLPTPEKCPDCRHTDRVKARAPRHLFDRACGKCSAPIKTTYSEKSPEIVYCEKCYLDSLE